MPRRQHQQRQLLAAAAPSLLFLLLLLLPLAGAFLLPSSSPTPRLPVPLSKQLQPVVAPLPVSLPQQQPQHAATWDRRRRRGRRPTARFVGEGDGGQEQEGQQLNPLDELERQLKGQEPPTVYVQQTPQGKMRIPLPPGPNRVLILFSIGTALALGAFGLAVGHFVGVPPLATLSLQPGGAATGFLLALPLFAVDFILQGFQEDTASEVYSLSIFGTKTPLPLVLALAAAVTLATGIGEEVLFRGLIQEGLSGVLGGVGGLIAASLAFGLSHKMGPADISFITAAGAYMGLSYFFLHDLTVPIALHSAYDFLILTSAYFRAKIRIGPQGD